MKSTLRLELDFFQVAGDRGRPAPRLQPATGCFEPVRLTVNAENSLGWFLDSCELTIDLPVVGVGGKARNLSDLGTNPNALPVNPNGLGTLQQAATSGAYRLISGE